MQIVDYTQTPISFLTQPLDNTQARCLISRLARIMRSDSIELKPALPPPPAGDPVALFLLSTYGMPSTGGAK